MARSALALLSVLLFKVFCLRNIAAVAATSNFTFSTLPVDSNGTELAYLDSGIPSTSKDSYTTLVAVHGLVFSSPVFERVMQLAPAHGLRIVAVNRRDYHGSTPFSPAELEVLANGTDSQRTAFLLARGVELATFMDNFIQKFSIPPISGNGKGGGIALLGWSLGNSFSIATVAAAENLPSNVSQRLKKYLKTLILQEPPSIALGTPLPPQSWSPMIDTSIPSEDRTPGFTQWITSYFQHGNLSTRDVNVLSYVLPTTFKTPSIFGMSPQEISAIVDEGPADVSEAFFLANFGPPFLAQFRKALFDGSTRKFWPALEIWELSGDVTCNFSIVAFWQIQNENEARGGNLVNFKLIGGVNHFMHWDAAQETIQAYLESINQRKGSVSS